MTEQEKFESLYIPEPNTGCWLWLGNLNNSGYGSLNINSHAWMAHRLSWTLFNGVIPDSAWVLHKCDNKSCVNPLHLFLGNNSINQIDARQKGVKLGWSYHHDKMRALTHCKYGHEYSVENTRTYVNKLGYTHRLCRKCHALYEKERRLERRMYAQEVSLCQA